MASLLISFVVVFFFGYTAGIAVIRLNARRRDRLRCRRTAPRGALIVELGAPRGPQAVRSAASSGGVA